MSHPLARITAGPVDAPTLVLLHGITASALSQTDAIDHWTALGYRVVAVDARAGYDEDGVFVRCDLTWDDERALAAPALERAACEGVDAWAADVAAGRAAAGPLAPVLSDYFDVLLGMGERVEVLRGARVIGRGTLVGVDVWGRATVRLEGDAQELEVAPEQARLRWA